jgi:hypothetical protein
MYCNLFIIFIFIIIISIVLYYNYNELNDNYDKFTNIKDIDDMKLDLNICSTKCCKHTQYLPDYLQKDNNVGILNSNALNDNIINCATDEDYIFNNTNELIPYNNSNNNYSCTNYNDKTYTTKLNSNEYIPSNFSCDGGCVCITNKNYNFLSNRGTGYN